jgi:hypothetical protein
MPCHIIPPRQWPKPEVKPKRAITIEEHKKILDAEKNNDERRHYYELLWLLGAAQTDCAMLTADKNINWENRVISYSRCKTISLAVSLASKRAGRKWPDENPNWLGTVC